MAVATAGGSAAASAPACWAGGARCSIFALAYFAYESTRALATGGYDAALRNAHRVLHVEAFLGLDIEGAVQRAVHGSSVIDVLNLVYLAAQPIVIPVVVIWAYRRSRPVYRVLRDTLITTWVLALPIYALFPTAPPRLSGVGVTDTVSAQSGVALDSHLTTIFYNPYAAVPSLHAAFAMAVGIAGALVARRWWSRLAWACWGPLVVVAVIATGNHFWLDVAAGVVLLLIGFVLSGLLIRRDGAHGVAQRWHNATRIPRAQRLPAGTR